MKTWRIISEDKEESRIITASGPKFPYAEIDEFVREHYFGKYWIEEIYIDN